ncbi:uncharacterized protein [Dermacentor andersoni]|uniref:uncharacterized protein n=1 Tax=Dermacentor andersoni TaxID=34620 RepID=UPI0024163798|nr:uncharacterized protein LOC126540045 [Dermacentor andersoni]
MSNATSSSRKLGGTQYCCVVQCHNSLQNTKGRHPPVKFYRFPAKWYETKRREAWIAAVRRVNPDKTPWEPTKTSRICSDHFVGNCKRDVSQHPSYVPTIFPSVYQKKRANLVRAERWEQCSVEQQRSRLSPPREETTEHTLAVSSNSGHHTGPTLSEVAETSISTEPVDLQLSNGTMTQVPAVAAVDVSCQTECSPSGKLSILVSATDGAAASTQVTHAQQLDKAGVPLFGGEA